MRSSLSSRCGNARLNLLPLRFEILASRTAIPVAPKFATECHERQCSGRRGIRVPCVPPTFSASRNYDDRLFRGQIEMEIAWQYAGTVSRRAKRNPDSYNLFMIFVPALFEWPGDGHSSTIGDAHFRVYPSCCRIAIIASTKLVRATNQDPVFLVRRELSKSQTAIAV